MRIRTILLVMSLLAFLSASVGGYLYYSSLREAAVKDAERQAQTRLVMLKKNLSSALSENIKPVKALAGMKELPQALSHPDKAALKKANAILDHMQKTLDVEVCYLIDRQGNTIASSNRQAPDSFVGKNFGFRPYFQQAIEGKAATYTALGVTSGKRGAYYSHPVYGPGGGPPLGVAVIKKSVDFIEEELATNEGEIVLVADPHGIIFVSSRPDWLFHTLAQLSAQETAAIAQTRQFGEGPWEWTGLTLEGARATGSGKAYQVQKLEIDNFPSWKVYYLRGPRAVAKIATDPLIKITGHIVILLCLFVGIAVGLLYLKASNEIGQRKAAEVALKSAQDQLSRYAQDLERQVRKRTREIASIFKYTPAVVYLKDHHGHYQLVNPRFEELFGISQEEVKGKADHDLFPRVIADPLRQNDVQVLTRERSVQVEEQVFHPDGVHTYLSVKFPLFDEFGLVSGLCGISTDITTIKQAQAQLKRLSGSIMANQEQERALIARELHDELGQSLTALQMDCMWMRSHIEETDQKAAVRALNMCSLIDKTIEEVRSIAVRLRPGVLDRLGLVDALEWFTSDFEKRTGITCIFERNGAFAISDTVATATYRIAQEALTNVARHAQAGCVNVSLRSENGTMHLSVSDNGRGFNARKLSEVEGLGVLGMRERASLVGGELMVKSEIGKGTLVSLKVPM